jgi:hypothetical protein
MTAGGGSGPTQLVLTIVWFPAVGPVAVLLAPDDLTYFGSIFSPLARTFLRLRNFRQICRMSRSRIFSPRSASSTPAFLRAHLWLRREQELTPLDTSDPEIFTG